VESGRLVYQRILPPPLDHIGLNVLGPGAVIAQENLVGRIGVEREADPEQ
jgi:hypothetical protein